MKNFKNLKQVELRKITQPIVDGFHKESRCEGTCDSINSARYNRNNTFFFYLYDSRSHITWNVFGVV